MFYSLAEGKFVSVPIGMESPKLPDAEDWKRIRYLENRLRTLADRKEKMEFLGVKEDSTRWKSLMYDIDIAEREYADWKDEYDL